jgi:hypothetical protein
MRGQQAGWSTKPQRKSWIDPGNLSRKRLTVSGIGWTLIGVIYLVLILTLGVLSFRKGHWILGLIGIFIPVFWLLGAILPARRRR